MSETRKLPQDAKQDGDGRAQGAKPEALTAEQEDKVKGGLSSSDPEDRSKLAAN